MTTLNEMTKKDLLALAKSANVSGRHEMTKDQLVAALELGTEPAGEFITKEQLVEIKRRRPSAAQRDSSGRVVRAGHNLSGNSPFRHKFYYLASPAQTEEYKAAVAAAPMQVQLLLKYMVAGKVTKETKARTGGEIAGNAISQGFLKTRIAPENLFAYYRRLLEALGVKQSFAMPDDEDGEEIEDESDEDEDEEGGE